MERTAAGISSHTHSLSSSTCQVTQLHLAQYQTTPLPVTFYRNSQSAHFKWEKWNSGVKLPILSYVTVRASSSAHTRRRQGTPPQNTQKENMFVDFPINKSYATKKIAHSNQEVGWLISVTSNQLARVLFVQAAILLQSEESCDGSNTADSTALWGIKSLQFCFTSIRKCQGVLKIQNGLL